MKRTYYFPTINGKPGLYWNGGYMGYADSNHPVRPVRTVRGVKKQIDKANAFDGEHGISGFAYGYLRIEITVED